MAKKGHLNDAAGLATASRDAGDLTPITDVFVRSYTKEFTPKTGNYKHVFKEKMDVFGISNDGNSTITLIIQRQVIPVYAGEVQRFTFSPFTNAVIFASGSYRFWGENAFQTVDDGNPVLVQDDFERTSASGLGTAPTGQTWTSYDSAGNVSSNWSIASGKAKTTGTSFQTEVTDSRMPDYYSVEAEIKQASGGNAANYGGLMISYPDASNSLFFRLDSSDNSVRLYIATAPATYTNLKQNPFTFTDGQVINFKVNKKGKDIEIFADGVSILTYTLSDADYNRTLSTKQGLFSKAPATEFDKYAVKMLGV